MMRIVSVNIEGSRHLDRVSELLDELDPDVVCMMELFERDRSILTERFEHTLFATGVLQAQDDHPIGGVGLGFASKEPFEPFSFKYSGPDAPGEYVKFDESVQQHWLIGGVVRGVAIATTHMMVTRDATIVAQQFVDCERIIRFLERYERVVFCGDLNTHRGGIIFERFASAFTDTIPAEVTTTLDQTLHRSAPIHLVVDGAFTRGIEARTTLRFGVSDHAALVIETSE
ncbi:MAG: endonuclease/exonuclease/phosphatase family protein [Candidatus Woesearchaeota archaeon]